MHQSMEFNEWKEAAIEVALERQIFKSSYRKCSIKKVFLQISQNSLQKICARMKLQDSVWNFVKKEILTEEFSCEFCEIFQNIFFTEHLWTNASRYSSKYLFYIVSNLQKMPLKKSIFSKVAGLQPATLIKTEHVHRQNLICSALMQNWCSYFIEDLLVASSKWIKTDILLNIMIKERCDNFYLTE